MAKVPELKTNLCIGQMFAHMIYLTDEDLQRQQSCFSVNNVVDLLILPSFHSSTMLNEEAVTNNDHLTLEWEEFWPPGLVKQDKPTLYCPKLCLRGEI